MSSPRILITNDDGVDAPGIGVMEAIARELSDDVWIVAPAGNESGASHRFTLRHELELVERRPRVFALPHGSPADCVVAGMTFLLKEHPADIVLSGVNNGQNVGDIVHCSGTAAGAREGALQGALGIAMSQGVDYDAGRDVDWAVARRFGRRVVEGISRNAGQGHWYNVNFPFCAPDEVAAIRAVPTQRFARSPMQYYPSDTPGKFFIAVPHTPVPSDPANDFFQLLHARAITVTPVSLQATDLDFAKGLDAQLTL